MYISQLQVNFSAFHSTFEVDTPLCSAKELDGYYQKKEEEKKVEKSKLGNV